MKKILSLFCALALMTGLAVPGKAIQPEKIPLRFHDETTLQYGPETATEGVHV